MKRSTNREEARKSEDSPPEPQEGWDRCHFYLQPKKRFCRQERFGSSKFCGNHQHVSENAAKGRKRIACPIDPRHYIFEDMVDKHITICPGLSKKQRHAEQEYYKENINCGGHGALESGIMSKEANIQWAQKLALRVLEVHKEIFSTNEPVDSVAQLSLQDIHDSIPMKDLSRDEIDAGMVESFSLNRIKSGGARHVPQLASLVGHLRSLDVLPPIGTPNSSSKKKPLILLEMGAGRGMLGLASAGAAAAGNVETRLIMVEREGTRAKADKVFRNLPPSDKTAKNNYMKLDKVDWTRIKCDLAHVSLPVVLENEKDDARVVVIAKHLCGAGTDLALKSITLIKPRVDACLLATCCHGICDWKEYVGRDFLKRAMETDSFTFGVAEFDLMRKWCAGTVSCQKSKDSVAEKAALSQGQDSSKKTESDEAEDEQAEHATKESDLDNDVSLQRVNIRTVVESLQLKCGIEGLGRACQRLIDHGRLHYLRTEIFENGMHKAEILHYVAPEISPQNACIAGKRIKNEV